MRPIAEIAEAMGLDTQAIIPYGHYKAKIPLEAIRTDGPKGKLVVVTGITPHPQARARPLPPWVWHKAWEGWASE